MNQPKFFEPCPARESGRHEVYSRGGVRYTRGPYCHVCGACELTEFDLMEAVIACAKSLVAGKKAPNTAHTQIETLQLALQGTVEALEQFQKEHPKDLIVRRGPPIGGGPKDR